MTPENVPDRSHDIRDEESIDWLQSEDTKCCMTSGLRTKSLAVELSWYKRSYIWPRKSSINRTAYAHLWLNGCLNVKDTQSPSPGLDTHKYLMLSQQRKEGNEG